MSIITISDDDSSIEENTPFAEDRSVICNKDSARGQTFSNNSLSKVNTYQHIKV